MAPRPRPASCAPKENTLLSRAQPSARIVQAVLSTIRQGQMPSRRAWTALPGAGRRFSQGLSIARCVPLDGPVWQGQRRAVVVPQGSMRLGTGVCRALSIRTVIAGRGMIAGTTTSGRRIPRGTSTSARASANRGFTTTSRHTPLTQRTYPKLLKLHDYEQLKFSTRMRKTLLFPYKADHRDLFIHNPRHSLVSRKLKSHQTEKPLRYFIITLQTSLGIMVTSA